MRVLVVDGYGSHTLVPTVLQKFKDRCIFKLMIPMPSHTSHELQPLDVSCFLKPSIFKRYPAYSRDTKGRGTYKLPVSFARSL